MAAVAPVALVTDSTSGLAPAVLAKLGVASVPLHVIIAETDYAEGVDISAQECATRLRRNLKLSTSRPSPAAFLQVYEDLAAAGAQRVVSIHLSAQVSGTCEAAVLAARDAPVPVDVIDSAQAGAGLGFAVVAAAAAIAEEQDSSAADSWGPEAVAAVAERAAAAALRSAAQTVTLFYVHTLEFLRRGGRIGAASAFLGGALAIKPLLELVDGHIEPVEKLRTQGRAIARLVELAAQRAAEYGGAIHVVVHHVDAAAKASAVADKIRAGLAPLGTLVGEVHIVPLPAVLAAHVGPGALGTVFAPAREGGEPISLTLDVDEAP